MAASDAASYAMNRIKDTGRCFLGTSVLRAGALLVLACGLLAGPAWAQHFEAMEYYHYDALGSVRLVVSYPHDSMTYTISRHDYLPFGEEIQPGTFGRARNLGYGTGDTTPQRFTGKERDPESNLDYFGARYYSGAQGRWTSADELMASENIADPQRWNRYAYVSNNPLAKIDPDGRQEVPILDPTMTYMIVRQQGGSHEQAMQAHAAVVKGQAAAAVSGDATLGAAAGGPSAGAALLATGKALWTEALIAVGLMGPPIGQMIAGNYGQVARSELETAAKASGPTIEVLTRQTSAPQAGRALSVAAGEGAEAVTNAARSGATLYGAAIPKALMEVMKKAGLVEAKTVAMKGSARATEYRFLPQAAEFIVKFFKEKK